MPARLLPPPLGPGPQRLLTPAHGAASWRVPQAGLDPHQGTHETMGWGRQPGCRGQRQETTDSQERGGGPRAHHPGARLSLGLVLFPTPSAQPCSFPGAGSLAAATRDARCSWPQEEFLGGKGCQMEKRQSGRRPAGLQKQESGCGPGPSVHPTSPGHTGWAPPLPRTDG